MPVEIPANRGLIQIRGIHGSFVSSNIPRTMDEFVPIKHFRRHKLAAACKPPIRRSRRPCDNVAMCTRNSVALRNETIRCKSACIPRTRPRHRVRVRNFERNKNGRSVARDVRDQKKKKKKKFRRKHRSLGFLQAFSAICSSLGDRFCDCIKINNSKKKKKRDERSNLQILLVGFFFFFGKKRIFKDKTLARVSYLSIIGVLN